MGSMKCIIPGIHLKVFGRAIQSLSKIGDELYFEAVDEGLSLRTVNSSRSAYACFQFAPNFFTSYITGQGKDDRGVSNDDGLRCKIAMKSVMNVFRSLPTIDKTVEKCKISLNVKDDSLVFQMYCRHGIVKTHNLSYMDSETLQAIFSRDTCPNKLTAGPKLLCDAVLNFQAHQEEVTLILRQDFVALKNYVDKDDPHVSRVIHTELTLSPEEFDSFHVGQDTDVTFCLKELRAMLAFADLTSLPMNLHIESPGKPVTFSITSDLSFEANFVLATLAETDDLPGQSQAGISRTNGKQNSSRYNSQGSKKQGARTPTPHHGHRKERQRVLDEMDEDGDEEMALMDISDTTVLEPAARSKAPHVPTHIPHASHVKHRDKPFAPSDSTRISKNGIVGNQTGTQKNNSLHHTKQSEKNSAPNCNKDLSVSLNTSNFDTATGQSTLHCNPSSQRSARTDKGGFYVSASEESQEMRSDIETGRTDTDRAGHNARQTSHKRPFDFDEGNHHEDEISQVIPLRDDTIPSPLPDQTKSCLSVHMEGDEDPANQEKEEEEEEEEEAICATPPSKRFRSLFFSTQSSTQSTVASQAPPAVLCPDSDSDG